jgi:hypothetical protein
VDVDRWQHVAAVFDPAEEKARLYKNGSLIKTASSLGYDAATSPVAVGHNPGPAGERFFDGVVDDVRVFRQALPGHRIRHLYRRAPRFHMRFDEAVGATQFADSSGNEHDGTCSDGCPSAGLQGRIGLAVAFDGGDDVIIIPHDAGVDLEALTVGAWIMPLSLEADTQALIRKGSTSNGDNYEIYLEGGRIHYRVGFGDCQAGPRHGQSKGSVIPNAWNHVMMTFQGDQLTLYLNGSLDSRWAPAGSKSGVCQNDEPLRIGAGPVTRAFAGRIDEVTLYDHALTAREVRDIFEYQAKWVEERQSHDVTVDNDAPTSTLRSDGPYLAPRDVVMHVEAQDPTSGIALVRMGVQGPGQGAYTWTGAPRCMDAPSDAAWCPTFEPSGEGRYRFKTTAIDQVGNREQPPAGPVTVYVDGTPPVVTSDLADGDLVRPTPHSSQEKTWFLPLSGTVSDPLLPGGWAGSGVVTDSVHVTLLGTDGIIAGRVMQTATVSGTHWTLDYLLNEVEPSGDYTLRVESADVLGNRTAVPTDSDLVTFHVDATAPAANLDLTDLPTVLTGAVTLGGDATEHPVPVVISWTTGDEGEEAGLTVACDGVTLYHHPAATRTFQAGTTYAWQGDVHRDLACQVSAAGDVVSGTVAVCGCEVKDWDGGAGVSFTADAAACGGVVPAAGVDGVEVAFRPTLPGSPFYNEAPPAGQVLHLPFEDTPTVSETLILRDISGQDHHGQCEGDACPTMGAPGHAGSGARFDGVDDYVEIVPADDLALADAGTLAAWIYPSGAGSHVSGGGIVINKEGEYQVARYVDGSIRWAFHNDDPGWHWVNTEHIAPLNEWTHVVVSYDVGVVKTYANGGLVHTRTVSGDIRPAGYHDVRVGGRSSLAQHFDGVIDEVRVFDRVLSPDEIQALTLGSGPLVALSFDEPWAADGGTVHDESGWEHHGTLHTGDALNRAVPGKVGAHALQFDGVDDYVSLERSYDVDQYDNVSMAAWSYPTGEGSAGEQGGIVVNKEGEFEVARFGDGTIHWAFNNDDPGWAWQDTGCEAPLNQWTHVAVVYDAGTVRTFADGVLVHAYHGSGTLSQHGELRVGGRTFSSQHFDGLMDDVRVYPRALAELEVKALCDSAWREATLVDVGAGADRKGWSLPVPDGLEGNYRIDLRAWDAFGNVDSAQGRRAWEGPIDSLAPRTTLTDTQYGESATTVWGQYAWSGWDFNLSEEGCDGICGRFEPQREYATYTAPWYVALSGDDASGSRLYGMTGDWRQRIPYEDTPGTARSVFAHGAHAYVADGGAGLRVVEVQGRLHPEEVGALKLGTIEPRASSSARIRRAQERSTPTWRPRSRRPLPRPTSTSSTRPTMGGDSDLGDEICNDSTDHCTLRAAIEQLNHNAVPATIAFDIPGHKPHTITVTDELPSLVYPVVVDGTTQPGTFCITGTLLVELDGSHAGADATGLRLGADDSSVRGLVINSFDGDGVRLSASSGVTVTCNLIGTEPDGVTDAGNGGHGVRVEASDARIGGKAPGEGNVIAHNGGDGVFVASGTGNAIVSNAIFSSSDLGIDLAPDGVTGNDADDTDSGPNNLQNTPELIFAGLQGGQVDARYRVPSTTTHASYPLTIEFFLADGDDQEGQTLIGSDPYYWEGLAGRTRTRRFPPAVSVAPGDIIVATATDDDGNTSEFSAPITVTLVTNVHVVNSTGDGENDDLDDDV